MLKLSSLIQVIENFAPLAYQEGYDNSGLQSGDPNKEIHQALVTIDITEEVLNEAIKTNADLIISHHPLFFKEIKKITPVTALGRIVQKAIKNDIALYSCHTNLDAILHGVNNKICQKLNIKHTEILNPIKENLKKLVTFIPEKYATEVRKSIFEAGAGHIGNYDMCSFNIGGSGSFRGDDNSNPFVGKKGQLHFEDEIRFETIFPADKQSQIINALLISHPYEEVAYDIYPLDNIYKKAGSGMIGELDKPVELLELLQKVKKTFHIPCIRYSQSKIGKVRRIAVCGGSGSFLLKQAIQKKADIFLTSDIKYHQFFETEHNTVLADMGHYESEQFTKEIIYDLLIENFPKFALRFSNINTNPIKYY